jgi:striatin 1/3/4
VWNLESRTCVQEMTAHRKKFDESILDVAFHPSRPYIASAGKYTIDYLFFYAIGSSRLVKLWIPENQF